MLLDEPTSHLDLSNRDRILGILSALAKRGVTIIFTTHDPNLVAATSDYVVLLRQGAILAAGTLATTLTAEHLSATYGIAVQVLQLEGQLFVVSNNSRDLAQIGR